MLSMPSDSSDFERRIAGAEPALRRFFDSGNPVIVTRAPGRLDVMGGVADYSGSLALEATVGEATLVALQRRIDDTVRVWSRGAGLECDLVETTLSRLVGEAGEVGRRLKQDEKSRWAAYVLGGFTILIGDGRLGEHAGGANIVVQSNVPLSAGLASSAALEVAAMKAITVACGIDIDAQTIAVLAQRVENIVVGAPCGIMDQMASTLGQEQRLLVLLCQPYEVQGFCAFPKGVRIFGIHSNVRHSVSGNPYVRARVAAFMGRKIINERRRHEDVAPLRFLCEVTPDQYRRDYSGIVPGKMTGREFLDAYAGHEDSVTKVEPDGVYPVRASTEHAIYENARVKTFLTSLEEAGRSLASGRTTALIRAGMAMYGSHWSYTRIGLGCRETTMLTRLSRAAGPAHGIFGAKITGGGSGGVVAVLTCDEGAQEAVGDIANEYARLSGNEPRVVVGGMSPGAAAFGSRTVNLY